MENFQILADFDDIVSYHTIMKQSFRMPNFYAGILELEKPMLEVIQTGKHTGNEVQFRALEVAQVTWILEAEIEKLEHEIKEELTDLNVELIISYSITLKRLQKLWQYHLQKDTLNFISEYLNQLQERLQNFY